MRLGRGGQLLGQFTIGHVEFGIVGSYCSSDQTLFLSFSISFFLFLPFGGTQAVDLVLLSLQKA